VPANAGAVQAVASSTSISFLEGKDEPEAVRPMYQAAGIQLNPSCDLAAHIAAAGEVCDQWLSGKVRKIPIGLLFRGIQMDKIATSVLAAKKHPKLADHLRNLASGSLDVMDRRSSKAKNTLWELELHALLLARGIAADLDDPDIVAKLSDTVIGIAWKKIYFHKNVEKTLSGGVAQTEEVSEYGLLAINLDDLWPPNQLRASPSDEELGHSMTQENLAFLKQHERQCGEGREMKMIWRISRQ